MPETIARTDEIAKYARTYAKQPRYRMKAERMHDAVHDLSVLPCRGAYLDVACGRGDMLLQARLLGFKPVQGTEVVPSLLKPGRVVYGIAHALPFEDKSFDVVTLFDVIEHLLPGDDELACRELTRVARKYILLTANNKDSLNADGDVLHINIRAYQDWDRLFRTWFPGKITWIKGARQYVSEAWRVDLCA